jgi:hypothetical protein
MAVAEREQNIRGGQFHGKMGQAIEHMYSLRSVLLFANIDVSRHILVIDTSILANIETYLDRRE